MVAARRAFLASGHYKPLAERVAHLVAEHTAKGEPILDAGCGEGYYTDIIERSMKSRDGESSVFAFDISKNAVREMRRKNPSVNAVVAGSYHMPIATASVASVVNTFSPLAREEVWRVLRDGGIFVMAIPEEMHLYELKAAIYDTPYRNTVDDPALEGFELLSSERITYVMHLDDRETVASLFGMTPYAYRTGSKGRERVAALERLDCTADFRIFVYKKK
jgi:23S rRNA (guanine745-N1)-methyltransferase